MSTLLFFIFMDFITREIPLQEIDLAHFDVVGTKMYILREDLIHDKVSGNKFRKLKYNISQARLLKHPTLLTFGGAYSNHIAAVAAAGKEYNFKTIGIIRGEEIRSRIDQNPTLRFASECGMQLDFVSREAYKLKDTIAFYESLKKQFGTFYLLPEGGTNNLAINGCEEILGERTKEFDVICVSVGTGGTLAGIVNSALPNQRVIGFSALKGTFQKNDMSPYLRSSNQFQITDNYCFGGYGKIDLELVRFINEFYQKTNIPLDPIYTGKMMFGIFDLIRTGELNENNRILAVHTGGLQGLVGMNLKLKKKNLPQIDINYVD
jgi:1-aminocyclopropane-1-carboxylate deaminase/D-cysteine desulfhydrase-like pyridoxal-dependent ACC family enzyme